jgi:ATP-binding cassette, subfamily C, bacteriocin exporter
MIFSERKLRKFYVTQLGEYACGLACLSTMSRLLGLIQAAKEIGMEAKGFEAELSHLIELESPVILHVILDKVREHYVVCFGHQEEVLGQ